MPQRYSLTFKLTVIVLTGLAGAMIIRSEWTGAPDGHDSQDPVDFYSGNAINWIVPHKPGGGYDDYTRRIAPFLERRTGASIRVHNLPGAGGARGLSELFRSPPDGLTISIVNGGGLASRYLTDPDNPDNDIQSLSYLGRLAFEPRVLLVRDDGVITSFQELLAAGQDVLLGATGRGGQTYLDAMVTIQALTGEARLVLGYENLAAVRRALLTGQVTACWFSWSSANRFVSPGNLRVLAHSGLEPDPDFPGVPSVGELAGAGPGSDQKLDLLKTWNAMIHLGRIVAAPPGVPKERLDFLRQSLSDTLADPEVTEVLSLVNRPLRPASGAEVEILFNDVANLRLAGSDALLKAAGATRK